ncbi:MAG TPA: TetR/AcrR family transcriptional regulator [Acidimicrobiales bacterium]|nr:TetR/AcrR family transcriptional regulator [Acidimicrobiales bacterium]
MSKATSSEAEALTWRERSVARSLEAARQRSLTRSMEYVSVARSLLEESSGGSFTVQQVVDRSGTSLRSFYQHFASKDELLLAVFEETIGEAAERWRAESTQIDDPAEQLHRVIVEICSEPLKSPRRMIATVLARTHLEMADRYPAELKRALRPLWELLAEIIGRGLRLGRVRVSNPHHSAEIVLHLLVGHIHAKLLDTEEDGVTAEELWDLCWRGLSSAKSD